MQRTASPRSFLALTVGAIALALLPACDAEEKCGPLADHVVEIVAATQPEVSDEQKTLARKDTLATCAQETPEPAVYDCAMAAKTVDELKACDDKATEK